MESEAPPEGGTTSDGVIHEKYPNIRQEEQAKLLQSLEKFLYKLEISSTLTDTEKQCYQQTKKFRDDLIRI